MFPSKKRWELYHFESRDTGNNKAVVACVTFEVLLPQRCLSTVSEFTHILSDNSGGFFVPDYEKNPSSLTQKS
jgi:hypothetical protein